MVLEQRCLVILHKIQHVSTRIDNVLCGHILGDYTNIVDIKIGGKSTLF